MKKFKNKQEITDFCYNLLDKHNVKHPDTYTEQELIDLNPSVPVHFIKEHVKKRDRRK